MARQILPPIHSKKTVTQQQAGALDFNLEDLDINVSSSVDDSAATRTVASRQRLHDKLMSDVDAFLARGGKIHQVENNVTADPPKKPVSNYGQRPL